MIECYWVEMLFFLETKGSSFSECTGWFGQVDHASVMKNLMEDDGKFFTFSSLSIVTFHFYVSFFNWMNMSLFPAFVPMTVLCTSF